MCKEFYSDMLEEINLNSDQFQDYITGMRTYRDKFLAHLDEERTMHIPKMETAEKAIKFLHGYLVSVDALNSDLAGIPTDLAKYCRECCSDAVSFLDRYKI
ncbi:hypothetical protein GI582_20590 [Sulfitobacter sp. BDSS02]|nr:hypothetical protein [Sulfitobacter sp. BDSS02]MBR9851042.1 hypothetical protein [Paracoccaceae bacterium]